MIHIKNVTEWEKGDSDKAIYNILKYKDLLANKELEYNYLLNRVNEARRILEMIKILYEESRHVSISPFTKDDIDRLIFILNI